MAFCGIKQLVANVLTTYSFLLLLIYDLPGDKITLNSSTETNPESFQHKEVKRV